METGKQVKLNCDICCGKCGAVMHTDKAGMPKYCACCGTSLGRFCLNCAKEVEMFFDEWWPGENECVRTYYPAKRCPACNAGLENPREEASGEDEDS